MRKVHIALCVLISAVFVALGVFVFYPSYLRFGEAIADMGRSIGVYFCEIFSIPYTFTASFLQPSSVFGWADYLPENYDMVQIRPVFFYAKGESNRPRLIYIPLN